jgi:hypothetical protein
MIVGSNETSPRVEIPLRGGPNETVPGKGKVRLGIAQESW